MRSKALLCQAAIVAYAMSSMAQANVYSVNIVGYATVSVPPGYSLLANPLSTGVTNGANEIMPVIDGEQILTWNGSGFSYVSFDSGFGGWVDANQAPAAAPSLPPGKGFFFYNPGGFATNVTFVGQVVPGPLSTNCLQIPVGYSLIGSPLPATVTNITSAPVRLPLIDGLQILTWNGSGYVYTSYDTGFGGWIDANSAPTNAPPYTLGQGFFLFQPSAAATWCQNLP